MASRKEKLADVLKVRHPVTEPNINKVEAGLNAAGFPTVVEKTEAQAGEPSAQPEPYQLSRRPSSRIGGVATLGSIVSANANKLSELQSQLAQGVTVVDLDPEKIDPSFVSDRLGGSETEAQELLEQIRVQGQLVPILVRPHPTHQGRYQVAYGHRRLRAVKELGRKVRAVVRELTDEQMVVAQGQENSARLDLTFIEKALFAKNLQLRGFSDKVIAAALNQAQVANISQYRKVTENIPDDIVASIGRAPQVGRPRWTSLAEILEDFKKVDVAKRIIEEPEFLVLGSDERFQYLLTGLSREEGSSKLAPAISPQSAVWTDSSTGMSASFTYTKKRCTVQIDRQVDPEFATFLYGKLSDLYLDFRKSKVSETPPE